MCGTALCLLLLDWMSTFEQAIVCVMVTMAMIAVGSGGAPVTPQDMAPKFAGTLFGESSGPSDPPCEPLGEVNCQL